MAIEKAGWSRASAELSPEALATLMPEEQQKYADKREAQSRLNLARSFASTGDPARAIMELSAALQLDKDIAQQPDILDLAAQLTRQPRNEALAAVLYRAEQMGKAENDDAPRGGLAPVLQQMGVMVLTSVLLFGTLTALVIIMNGRLNGLGGQGLIRYVSAEHFGRVIPTGGLFLLTVYAATFTMFFVGGNLSGQGTLTRFMSIMLVVQWVTWLAITLVLIFLPIFNFVPLGDGTTAVRINFPIAIIAVMGNFLWQSYFAALAHKADLGRAIIMVFLGVIAGLVVGALLGVWRQLGF
jgi:hypothetical protein